MLIAFIGIPFKQMSLSTLVAFTLLPVFTWFSDLPFLNWLITSHLPRRRLLQKSLLAQYLW